MVSAVEFGILFLENQSINVVMVLDPLADTSTCRYLHVIMFYKSLPL